MNSIRKSTQNKSIAVGAGLVALDVIVNGSPSTPAKLCAGGSCGNVLAILSFLGWSSNPIARLNDNSAAEKLLYDFANFSINTELISMTDDGVTPIIIHRILKDGDGKPKHKFEFKIPQTNIWLPSYKPVLASSVKDIISKKRSCNAFYFDRVNRSSIELAKYYKGLGAVIVFEPSSIVDNKQFKECLSISDIVKFSKDRISNYETLYPEPNAPLEIETLGEDGLRFRIKNRNNNKWMYNPAYKLDNWTDSAGAGDWCTAGIINELAFDGANSFYNASTEEIQQSLKIGQILGAINCLYDGARGAMYNLDLKSVTTMVDCILHNISYKTNIHSSHIDILTINDFCFESIL
ncbi:hypothetical protein LRS05_16135 [Flavobacterium sp. J372]|uniref:hypothetical protein n=1 Tax=Flavobacterium sp. J372 TaxID=2898436 RepID=UPI0021518F3D|nr:hypothetical protein [Flavobacterium sp. J372]MCR5863554.1 hypothetical protein [Flavobacterium sp. J372]